MKNLKGLFNLAYVSVFALVSAYIIQSFLINRNTQSFLSDYDLNFNSNKLIVIAICYIFTAIYSKSQKRRLIILIANISTVGSAYIDSSPYSQILTWVSFVAIGSFYLLIVLDLFSSVFSIFKVRAQAFKAKKGIVDPTSKSFYSSEAWRKLRPVVFSMYGHQCMNPRCGNKEELQVDHIKPRSKFPHLALDLNNLQILCGPCNRKKSNVEITDYR